MWPLASLGLSPPHCWRFLLFMVDVRRDTTFLSLFHLPCSSTYNLNPIPPNYTFIPDSPYSPHIYPQILYYLLYPRCTVLTPSPRIRTATTTSLPPSFPPSRPRRSLLPTLPPAFPPTPLPLPLRYLPLLRQPVTVAIKVRGERTPESKLQGFGLWGQRNGYHGERSSLGEKGWECRFRAFVLL